MTPFRKPIPHLVEALKHAFTSGRTRPVSRRLVHLKTLKSLVTNHQTDIMAALKADLNKSSEEAFMTEINVVRHEIDYAIKHLKSWARPRRVRTPMLLWPAKSRIHSEPLGTVLIIGPWNYPFNLVFCPLVGALAAGNTVLLKPSELAAHTSRLIRDLITKYFDPSIVSVVEGGPEETGALLAHRFDLIFFTGGETVGKIVMEAAAKHLTPVVLELGGKSPCIVDQNIDVRMAARRISWGKFMNAGQTCVAPDYLLVDRRVKDALIDEIQTAVTSFFGKDPKQSPHYGRIVHTKHVSRLQSLLDGNTVIMGGESDIGSRYIAPTLIDPATPDSPVMQEEIFGPLLPVLSYETLDEAVSFITNRPKPLALYLFSNDKEVENRVLSQTSSGGVCINDTLFQITSTELPFGGVGTSGMGNYHGKASFDTFSHTKSVLKRYLFADPFFRYAPFPSYLNRVLKLLS